MTTTYQITADTMAQKLGAEEALRQARSFARKGDTFWRYVAVCLEQTTAITRMDGEHET